MKVTALVAQSYTTFTTTYSPPGSSVHRILQAKILQRGAIPFCKRSSQPKAQTQVSCTAGRFLTILATYLNKRIALLQKGIFQSSTERSWVGSQANESKAQQGNKCMDRLVSCKRKIGFWSTGVCVPSRGIPAPLNRGRPPLPH